jgi:hypothetical protein
MSYSKFILIEAYQIFVGAFFYEYSIFFIKSFELNWNLFSLHYFPHNWLKKSSHLIWLDSEK